MVDECAIINPVKRELKFNSPFWVVMKEKNKHPYLCIRINNLWSFIHMHPSNHKILINLLEFYVSLGRNVWMLIICSCCGFFSVQLRCLLTKVILPVIVEWAVLSCGPSCSPSLSVSRRINPWPALSSPQIFCPNWPSPASCSVLSQILWELRPKYRRWLPRCQLQPRLRFIPCVTSWQCRRGRGFQWKFLRFRAIISIWWLFRWWAVNTILIISWVRWVTIRWKFPGFLFGFFIINPSPFFLKLPRDFSCWSNFSTLRWVQFISSWEWQSKAGLLHRNPRCWVPFPSNNANFRVWTKIKWIVLEVPAQRRSLGTSIWSASTICGISALSWRWLLTVSWIIPVSSCKWPSFYLLIFLKFARGASP